MLNSMKIKGLFLLTFLFAISLTANAQVKAKTEATKIERVSTPNGTKAVNKKAKAKTNDRISTPKTKQTKGKVKTTSTAKNKAVKTQAKKTAKATTKATTKAAKTDRVSTPQMKKTSNYNNVLKKPSQTSDVLSPENEKAIQDAKVAKQKSKAKMKTEAAKKNTDTQKINGETRKSIKKAKVKSPNGAATKGAFGN